MKIHAIHADSKKSETREPRRLRHVTPPDFAAPPGPVTQAIVTLARSIPTTPAPANDPGR